MIGKGAAPAFVLDKRNLRHAWQFAMPSKAPAGVSEQGMGQGTYNGVSNVKSVVGIVGSAHVGGIIREWETASNLDQITTLLEKER